MSEEKYTRVQTKADVTPEIEEMVADIAESWPDAIFADILERAESYLLDDFSHPDFGPKASSPAINYLRKVVREARK